MRKLQIVLMLTFCLTSCAINNITFDATNRIKQVKLGLTKSQLIEIMGKYYILDSNSINQSNESEEIIAYKIDANDEFRFKIIDDKLISWERVQINSIVTKEQLRN